MGCADRGRGGAPETEVFGTSRARAETGATGSPGEGAGAAPMALSESVIVISGEEGSVRAAVAATAMSEVAPIGWADPRGHVERKKANSARRSEIWVTNTSIPTYGRRVQ